MTLKLRSNYVSNPEDAQMDYLKDHFDLIDTKVYQSLTPGGDVSDEANVKKATAVIVNDVVGKVLEGVEIKATGAARTRRRKSLHSNLSQAFHEVVVNRFEEYRTAAPWHLCPREDYGRRIFLFLAGLPEKDCDGIFHAQLDQVFDTLLEHGFSLEVAQRWSDVIADEVAVVASEQLKAGGYQTGRA
jgi:hypothetical protein